MQEPPVLLLPIIKDRFHLQLDTSKFVTGSVPYQLQNRKPKLTIDTRKRMPEATRKYSITDVKLCGLATNIASFAHQWKKVDFDEKVDHIALTYIAKSMTESATHRIKRSLEVCVTLQLYQLQ